MEAPPAIETARTLLDASEAADPDEYVRHVTEDVVINPPGFVIGPAEVRGHEGVRAGFAKLEETLGSDRKLQLRSRRFFLDREDKSKALVCIEIRIRGAGTESFGTEAAMLNTMAGDKVSRIDSWTTCEEGLSQLQDPVEIAV